MHEPSKSIVSHLHYQSMIGTRGHPNALRIFPWSSQVGPLGGVPNTRLETP
jgi:hypothetical protein